MAWSTPASWSVGEVVTASKLNTHLKANLEYLKGAAGTITLDADLAVTRSAAGATVGAYVDNTGGSSSGTLSRFAIGMTTTEANALLLQFDHNANEATIYNRGSGNLILQTNNANTIVNTNGFALNVASPTGKLHGYNTISGFLAWEYNGVDGTTRTIIADGTGDVLYGLVYIWTIRVSDGNVSGGVSREDASTLPTVRPGNTHTLWSSGGNTLVLTCNANGSVTIARTAGTATFKVTLWAIWL